MASVRRSGIDIHYETTGSGPPVILAHSLMCSVDMWARQVPALAKRYRVVNVDARGHGASGRVTTPYTLYDSLADHLAVLDDLGIERAVWIGLSQGGMIALRAALEHPERVAALALIDTDAGAETLLTRLKERALVALARVVGTQRVLPQVAKIMFGRTSLRERPALVAEWGQRFAAMDLETVSHALGAVLTRDELSPRLSKITVPALVMAGLEDQALPVERSRRLAAALPRARLVEIPRAGHLAALEQPDVVTSELLGFLDEIKWGPRVAPSAATPPPPA